MSLVVTDNFEKNIFSRQNSSPIFKVEILSLDDGNGNTVTADITEFVSNIGSISRRASFEIGKMTPSSHSLTIKDSKKLSDFLFMVRKNYGTDFWMNKEIVISIGFKSGNTDDLFEIYRGKIDSKTEDRINGIIKVNSKDILKDFHDFKACTKLNATDVFVYILGFVDERGFQQVIKYGTHKLIGTDGDRSPRRDRNTPFSMTIGVPNISNGKPIGTDNNQNARRWWFFPFQNEIDTTLSQWNAGAPTLKLYFWDYVDRQWLSFLPADIADGKLFIQTISGHDGIFLEIESSFTLPIGGTLSGYLDGTGTRWGDDGNELDAVIAIETTSKIDANPVRILHDLFTNARFLNEAATILDFKDFDETNTSNFDFTFDKVFDFFELENAKINTSFVTEQSIMNIVNEISRIGGFSVLGGAKKDKTTKSGGTDHRIRLIDISPQNNDPDCGGTVQTNLLYSTADKVKSFEVLTSSDIIKTKVTSTNFNTAKSTREFFDIKEKSRPLVGQETEKVLQLGTDRNPRVYYYDSGAFALAIVERYFNLLSTSFEQFTLNIDKSGIVIESGDLINVHDKTIDETRTIQIAEVNYNLNNYDTRIVGKRFPLQYGPDEDEPLKLWAFFDCAFFAADAAIPPNGPGPNGETYHFF